MFWISKSIAPVRKSIWAHAILINHKLFANINYSSKQIIRTSSLAIVMLSVTFEKTVGSMKYPTFPCRWPPHSNLAPSFWPASIYLKTLLNISSSTCGPRIIFDVNVMCSKVTKYYWSCVCVCCVLYLVQYLHRMDCQLCERAPIWLLQQRKHRKFSHVRKYVCRH